MNLIFFQNCVSPHQIPYIKECVNDNRIENVILITPRVNYQQRTQMGWDDSNLIKNSNIKFYLNPDDNFVENILNLDDLYCIFSGIRADKDVYKWFLLSLKFKTKRAIITEPPNIYWNKPLWLHYLRFICQDKKYIKYIDYIFAFGPIAVSYYKSLSKKWKVIPFSYCTYPNKINLLPNKEYNNQIKLVFVGSLTKNKNVISILKALHAIKKEIEFHIIGDGPEKRNLEKYAKNKIINSNVFFHGIQPMKEVHKMLPEFDILILPSHYDGWGAVINEALQAGLYVLCSNNCGSQCLLTHNMIGRIFCSDKELTEVLNDCFININHIRDYREKRLLWSDNISGKKIAKYFINNLIINDNIEEPWKEKI